VLLVPDMKMFDQNESFNGGEYFFGKAGTARWLSESAGSTPIAGF